MSDTYIPANLRRLVSDRAKDLCEYCLIHEDDVYLGCQVDHIISEKHGGLTEQSNLAYACVFCNRYKGSDIGSVTTESVFTRFYNPRTDSWSEHFALDGILIKTLSNIGEVTARILDFNSVDRLLERQILKELGRYPSKEALIIIGQH